MKRAIGKAVSRVMVTAVINYVMVAIIAATAAAITVQTVSATVGDKLLALAAALKRTPF